MATMNGNSQPPGGADVERHEATGVIVPVGGVPGASGHAPNGSMAELRNRRRELAQRVAELTWDLGGLTYEMAIRNRVRVDILVQRAARLQEVDAELAEVERILRTEQTGAAGACGECGAPHSASSRAHRMRRYW